MSPAGGFEEGEGTGGIPLDARLLGYHGEHGQQDPVELVEAPPQPPLAETLEYLGAVRVFLLVGAVRHHLTVS